jgi:hypothetical protein
MHKTGIDVAVTERTGKQYNLFSGAKEEALMLWTIFVILLVLWLLGMVSSYTIGGFIHILLVIALVVLLLNIIGGRRTTI